MIRTLALVFLIYSLPAFSEDYQYEYSSELSSKDYLLGSNGMKKDPVFDNMRVVDLGIDLGIGSDCGQIDLRKTLRASLSNIFDQKYMEGMFTSIIGGAPMLLTCYMSPTWCAILKNAQLKANFLANMRMDQCSLIDKYTDSRVEDFERERQSCVRRYMKAKGGNAEEAMGACKNYWDADLASWTKSGRTSSKNQLLQDSAEWAGLTGTQSQGMLDLLKGMVGDTIVAKGNVSVDWGPRRVPLTPRTYLLELERANYDKLCIKILKKAKRGNVAKVVTNGDLKELSGGLDDYLIDRQTIRSLLFLPFNKRIRACKKLAEALAMPIFSQQMAQSLDALTHMTKNPNLPDNRKEELDRNRKAFKDQVDMAIKERKEKNAPLNNVLAHINAAGKKYQGLAAEASVEQDAASSANQRVKSVFMDCADGVFCAN